MRLTLRTLLAYMEDRLSPANAREIGQKIASSPFSTELMERIREVLRKRRLASPNQPQSAIDPNLIAEYLDDQLTPELVARIEREFLSSDVALAELAAVHQVIGSLHESVSIEPRLRQRLYELDPSGRLDAVRTIVGDKQESAALPADGTATEWKPLTKRMAGSRRLPTYLVLVMAFVWVIVVATDPVLFPSKNNEAEPQVAMNEPPGTGIDGTAANPAAAAAADAGSNASTIPDSEVPAVADTSTTAPNTATNTASATDAADTTGTDTVATEPGTTPDDDTTKPAGEAAVAAANTIPPADNAHQAAAEPPVVDIPEPAPTPVVLMNDPWKATLLVNPENGQWDVARPGGAAGLTPAQRDVFDWRDTLGTRWFAVPALFKATITLESAGWSAELIGPVIARMHTRTPQPGMTILTGRVLLKRLPGTADPAQFLLGSGPTMHQITLADPDSVVGVEVTPVPALQTAPPPPSASPLGIRILPIDTDHRISVYVVSGNMQLTDPNVGEAVDFGKSQAVSWLAMATGQSSDVVIQDALQPGMTPDWLFPSEPLPELDAVRDEIAGRIAGSSAMAVTAVEASKDRNPQIAVAAVGYLAVTRSIGPMISVLLQSEDESVRRAAIDGLTAVTRQTEAGFSEVQRQLETHLPMADADLAFALLYGVSDEQARQEAYCAELLGLLSHDRLILRELAAYRMQTIVGDRFGYSADADPGRRRESVRRWQRHLERNGGKLIP